MFITCNTAVTEILGRKDKKSLDRQRVCGLCDEKKDLKNRQYKAEKTENKKTNERFDTKTSHTLHKAFSIFHRRHFDLVSVMLLLLLFISNSWFQ